MSTGVKFAVEGVVLIIVGIVVATYTYYLGKSTGADEQKRAFDQIVTQVNLNGTKWEVSYEDVPASVSSPAPPPASKKAGLKPPPEKSPIKVAILEFTQSGSRIIGEGRDLSGRRWIVEGAAAERRVCYIYYDPDGKQLSMGTVLVAMDNAGTQMNGQWLGWSPESNELQPRSVTLKRIN